MNNQTDIELLKKTFDIIGIKYQVNLFGNIWIHDKNRDESFTFKFDDNGKNINGIS